MFKFISKLTGFSKSDFTVKKKDLPNVPVIPEQEATSEPFEDLWSSIEYLSSHENRFLNPQYSPMSRIPCADFTGFIIDRLRNNDLVSIRRLMRAIIFNNPGLGIGPGWIDGVVNNIAKMDFSRYFNCVNKDFILELKSLFILKSKDGGGREFWLTDYTPLLFSYSLCCHHIQWLEDMFELKEKASQFIKIMKKDAPFWRTYKLPEYTNVPFPSEAVYSMMSTLNKLPLLTRMHLMSFSEKGSGSLLHSTVYSMRNLGLNPLQTAPIILNSGLCETAVDEDSLLSTLSKNDLLNALSERKVPYKQSWNKAELFQALVSKAPDFLNQVAELEKIVRIKYNFLPYLRSILSYANSLEAPLTYLCFA